ncbi:MAG: hypothetical protein Q8M99_05415 [Methylotenera sp.]|nr:hypothetical protein [Methylotenera sp.]
MKNHYYEYVKRQFKNTTHRNCNFQKKVYCYNTFSDVGPKDLTWWTPFGFILNGCYISVDWVHPRMAFKDAIREKALKPVNHLYKERCHENFLDNSVPIYKKLGNSCKKIRAWQTIPSKLNTDGFGLALKLAEDNLAQEADFNIKPSIDVEWRKYGKFVSVCAPVEIRSIEDVASLALILKRILKHEISVDDVFNHHQYTRLDWLEEFNTAAERSFK